MTLWLALGEFTFLLCQQGEEGRGVDGEVASGVHYLKSVQLSTQTGEKMFGTVCCGKWTRNKTTKHGMMKS